MEFVKAEYKIISFLLSYPDSKEFWESLPEAREWADELGSNTLLSAVDALQSKGRHDLTDAYVHTFDFREPVSLYLTAHELGDNRNRGMALIVLQKQLASDGFYTSGGELPDYLPSLFEYLSMETSEDTTELEQRIATVCQRIHEILAPEGNAYALVFQAALERLPHVLDEDVSNLSDGEKPDLEDLPYPVHYS